MDEAALMDGVRARDVRAFEALYDEYHRLVYGVALRVLGDPRGAEDVTQSVFLKLWSDPAFRSGNFGGWIARVSRNRAIDVLRERAPISLDGSAATALVADDALEDGVVRAIEGRHVRELLARIPAEQREVIELGFFGGLSHDAIARKTGIPLGTVKTRIRTGLRRLRDALQGAGV